MLVACVRHCNLAIVCTLVGGLMDCQLNEADMKIDCLVYLDTIDWQFDSIVTV